MYKYTYTQYTQLNYNNYTATSDSFQPVPNATDMSSGMSQNAPK